MGYKGSVSLRYLLGFIVCMFVSLVDIALFQFEVEPRIELLTFYVVY